MLWLFWGGLFEPGTAHAAVKPLAQPGSDGSRQTEPSAEDLGFAHRKL